MTDGKKFILSPHGSWQLEQLVSERRAKPGVLAGRGMGRRVAMESSSWLCKCQCLLCMTCVYNIVYSTSH